jgi:hypothetical protein
MVCVSPPVTAIPERVAATAVTSHPEDCEEICLFHKRAEAAPPPAEQSADREQPGEICLFAPNDHETCTAAFAFAVAAPAVVIDVDASPVISERAPEALVLYVNPTLANLSPPPKA